MNNDYKKHHGRGFLLERLRRNTREENTVQARRERYIAYGIVVLCDAVVSWCVFTFVGAGRDPKVPAIGALPLAVCAFAVFLIVAILFIQGSRPGKRIMATVPFVMAAAGFLYFFGVR